MDGNGLAYDGPLIVLTSKATASAAEIVAQALKDYGVALIVGDVQTYGKGTIQAQTVTDNQSQLLFQSHSGQILYGFGQTPQKGGVKADVVVPGHWSENKLAKAIQIRSNLTLSSPAYNDQLQDISPESVHGISSIISRRYNIANHMA